LTATPSPSAASIGIRFTLPRDGSAVLQILDVSGRPVRTLLDTTLTAGEYDARWDGENSEDKERPSGVYLVRLTSRGNSRTVKVLLTR
jgi:flagellar hook assembly protein FlgD